MGKAESNLTMSDESSGRQHAQMHNYTHGAQTRHALSVKREGTAANAQLP